ncbi:MAG: hypothetical protein RLZZ416_219 [Candidatus Parcubacteria bacterium]
MKLFILHGWTYQTATWDALLGELRKRGIEYEFLLLPGLTDGTNPVWNIDDYIDWLKSKIGNERVVLYGHSAGGRLSLAFALKYPTQVERLILEDSAGIPPRGLRKLKRDFFRVFSPLNKILMPPEALRRAFYRLIRENDYGRATPEMRKTLANLVSIDLRNGLKNIRCPTLIIWGKGDKTTPLIDGQLMHEEIAGSRLQVIPDARHSPHITHPKEVAGLVASELRNT